MILPKKDAFKIVKCHEHIEILINSAGDQLFFRQRDGPWMPTLRLFHKFPFFLPMLQVDKGAIRFVLSGANIMCPGLTSPGACMTPVDKGTVSTWALSSKMFGFVEFRLLLFCTDRCHTGRREGKCISYWRDNTLNGRYVWENLFIYLNEQVINIFPIFCYSAKVNKGVGVENCHYLNDGLWQMKPIK